MSSTSAENSATATARENLAKWEEILQCSFLDFVIRGEALEAIQKDKLYREHSFREFETYLRCFWDIGPSWAYQLIMSSGIYRHLRNCGCPVLPLNEGQCRALGGIPRESLIETWNEIVKKAAGNTITAKFIRQVLSAKKDVAPKQEEENVEEIEPQNGSELAAEAGLTPEERENIDTGYRLLLGKFDESEREDVAGILYALSQRDVPPSLLGKVTKAWASFHSRFTPIQWRRASDALDEIFGALLDEDAEDSAEPSDQPRATLNPDQLEFAFADGLQCAVEEEGTTTEQPEATSVGERTTEPVRLGKRVPKTARPTDRHKSCPIVTITR